MKILRVKKKGLLLLVLLLIVLSISSYRYVKVSLYPTIKDIEKTRMLRAVKDYQTIDTEHFTIRYSDDIEIAKLTENIAEKYFDEVCSIFDYEPEEKVDIIIYNDKEALLENTRLNKSSSPMGLYYSGVISVLSPRLWVNNGEDINEVYEMNGPVVHEFTHYIVDEITNGNYPMWLTEGIALYTEYKTTGFEWGEGYSDSQDITIEELNSNFSELDQGLAYRRSFEVVNSISEKWGFDKLNIILDTLGEGSSINSSVRAVLKINLNELK